MQPSEVSCNKNMLCGDAISPDRHQENHQSSKLSFKLKRIKVNLIPSIITEIYGQHSLRVEQLCLYTIGECDCKRCGDGTWIIIAALVCFLNRNSLRAVIALKPVCKEIADKHRVK